MSSANSSVIICESPNSSNATDMPSDSVNYRKRLRSSSRNLLGTVYESPLNHFRRSLKTITETNEDSTEVTVLSTPPAKRLKTKLKRKNDTNSRQRFNLDESVIFICDQRAAEPVELAISDTEVNDPVEISEECQVLNSSKSPRKKLKKLMKKRTDRDALVQAKIPKRCKGKKATKKTRKIKKLGRSVVNKKTINDENHNDQIMHRRTDEDAVAICEDAEDIEVVWSSKPNAEVSDEEVRTVRFSTSPQKPIIVDMVPSSPKVRNDKNKTVWDNLPACCTADYTRMETGVTYGEGSSCQYPYSYETNALGSRQRDLSRLREIVVDGSNIAMGHSRNKKFSEKGLQIVIDYFESRGHTVKVFLPQSARARGRDLIEKLHVKGTVIFTPSRKIAGRHITPYDDRYILEYATKCRGIVVSSDQYRDLWLEKPEWRDTIEKRLLTPTFVGDYLMFPEDPLGRGGPCLNVFLRF